MNVISFFAAVLVAGLLSFSLAPRVAHAADDTVALKPCCGSDQSVYQDFGGREGIARLTSDFMRELLADDRTRPFFEHADQQRIILMLTDQICYATGGPCEYKGLSMTDAHKGLNIKRENFNALVEDLQKSMDRFNIPFRSQNKLLAVLAPMHRDIEQENPH